MYIDVLLPLAIDGVLTYLLPDEFTDSVEVGMRVVVPLGGRKFYTGIATKIHDHKPEYRLKRISSIVDSQPIVSETQLKFWEWIASYYMCTMGEVMKCAVPVALKSDGFNEDISGSYRIKTDSYITISASTEVELIDTLDKIKRAKAQHAALLKLADELSPIDFSNKKYTLKSAFSLRNEISHATLKALAERGAIMITDIEESRLEKFEITKFELPVLSKPQQRALSEIDSFFKTKNTVLLHGVTGSGKTEIYINLIQKQLDQGKDTLFLLPEIALTTQLIDRLKGYFGDKIIVYHSKFNDNKRAEVFFELGKRQRDPRLILGVRSSLLLPLDNLGLIIIDEEHETTYKQQDPAPRYHARDAAIMLAGMLGAKTLLGSATPSVESFFNATTEKYGLVTLAERYSGVQMPRILISDTIRAAKRGERNSFFSHLLLNEIEKAKANSKQTILFQNRRGFSPYVECSDCATVINCPHCNVSLTYHKNTESLVCHYCGYTQVMPKNCPSCVGENIKTMGFGTEKVEEEIVRILPNLSAERLDLDSSRSFKNFSKIISSFAAGRTDILVGTQMVTKGFDFENVSLVGILNADNMINFPDFRAAERSFQLMMQVAGRAGRRDQQGLVVIQTSQPKCNVITQIQNGDYEGMFRTQITERQAFLYPPFSRLIRFTLKHTKQDVLNRAANDFNTIMRRIFGKRLLGPEIPSVDKIRGEYLCGFLLKIEREKSFAEAKKYINRDISAFFKIEGYSTVTLIVDVDPV